MKITIDTKTNKVKVGTKTFSELDKLKRLEVENAIRNVICKNTKLSDYEEDCMWMSYRYCIGRHTIASHMHASNIWKHCKGRMNKERQLFTAYDINREIEQSLSFIKPYFHFPITSLNRIYISAIDIFCQFLEDFDIKSEKDLIKYRDVYIKLYDNERGYTFETITWEEYLRPNVHQIVSKYYDNQAMSEDFAWKYFTYWQENPDDMEQEEMKEAFKKISSDMPKPENYYMHDVEDLFVWNDLVHCFDYEHHHKSILTNGEEVIWFWGWDDNTEERAPREFYKTFGYHKVRIPVNEWNGSYSPYIPDELIKEDIY